MTEKNPLDFTGDPYWGQGGRYIVGPDGKRVPAPPEEVVPEGFAAIVDSGAQLGDASAPASAASTDAPKEGPLGGAADSQSTVKGKRNV